MTNKNSQLTAGAIAEATSAYVYGNRRPTASCAEQGQSCWEIGEVIPEQPQMRSVEVI